MGCGRSDVDTRKRPQEGGVPEGEDPAVLGGEEVPGVGGGGHHPHHRLVGHHVDPRSEPYKPDGMPDGEHEDPAVGAHQVITGPHVGEPCGRRRGARPGEGAHRHCDGFQAFRGDRCEGERADDLHRGGRRRSEGDLGG